jgi:hypothetical protein
MKRACKKLNTNTGEQNASSPASAGQAIRPLKLNFVRMKHLKVITLLLICFQLTLPVFAASDSTNIEKPWYMKGDVNGRLFINFNTSVGEEDKTRAFEVKRAYLGYSAEITQQFAASIKLDIGNPDDVKDYAAKKRFAYFKNAYLQYKYEGLRVQFGIADCFQFKFQESFWGYRYIQPVFQDKYKFGNSADIGLYAQYKFNKKLSVDVSFANGEGYSVPQNDETFKMSAGITASPFDWLVFRVYADNYENKDINQNALAAFSGVTFKKWSLGAEYNYLLNSGFKNNHNQYGYSVYGNYRIMQKIKLLGRFDMLKSNILEGETDPWNLSKDGSAIIAGVEFLPHKNVNFSLNYQDWLSYAANGNDSHFIFFNVLVTF